MKNTLVGLIMIGSILITAYVLKNNQSKVNKQPNVDHNITATVTPFIKTKPDTSTLERGGSSFLDKNGQYVLLYPNDYSLDSQEGNKYTRIIKRGESPRPQSEISDGVLLVFESIDLQGQTLSDFVDTRIKEAISDGNTEIAKPKTATTLNDYPGFTYDIDGFGYSTVLTIQKDPKSNYAVSIAILVADPKGKGYQSEVEATLSTLQLLK